jgi:hypothetical protein
MTSKTDEMVERLKTQAIVGARVECCYETLRAYLKQNGPGLLYLAIKDDDLVAMEVLQRTFALMLMLRDKDAAADLTQWLGEPK